MADEKQGKYSFFNVPEWEVKKPFEFTTRSAEWFGYFIAFLNFLILSSIFATFAQLIPSLWICIPGVFVMFGFSLFAKRKRAVEGRRREKKLAAAVQSMKASFHGTAVHVAGHPLLGRDQKVALALKGAHLGIYDEHLEEQLAAIHIDDMRLIYTVVYDDARVPHLKAVDSAAQALQIEFFIGSATYTVLFRSMLDPRPIDWYHALEQARFKGG